MRCDALALVAMLAACGASESRVASPSLRGMTLSSQDLHAGGALANAQLLDRYGCTGANASPELEWTGAPPDTKSFAILAFDPDAPTESGWWHWVVFDIPASATRVPANASRDRTLPAGAIEGRNDFGTTGYGGGCPPAGGGDHRYRFTVYALRVADLREVGFPIDANAPAAMVSFAVHATALAHATLEVHYHR